jgi:hypothetical protein
VYAACYDPPDWTARLTKKGAVASLAVVIDDENPEIRFGWWLAQVKKRKIKDSVLSLIAAGA